MLPNKYHVLIPDYQNRSNGESEKAEVIFKRFIQEGFSYEEISNHPDYLVYASAEMLLCMIPQIIEEMIARKDTENFLIYPIISALDPQAHEDFPSYKERTQKNIALADIPFAEKACQFLLAVEQDPPNGPEQVQRLLSFWKNKLDELQRR